ncbi:O-antigen polymerase [Daejeonella oryzae]|uniref:O-antigen polymerase n=1 Tax=Daejeonella oryzae TaxID=1122943 RepID=UPI00047D570C|nr:O-antigen polymerase [Daejeonella oryzae]
MEVLEKVIAIIYSIIILANALVLRRMMGTWLFPACILSLFWFFYTFFPLVFLFEVPVNSNSIAFITLAILLFSAPSLLFNWGKAFKDNLKKPNPAMVFNTRFLKLTLFCSILISVFSSLLHVTAQGFGFMDVFTDPVLVATTFAASRYAETLVYTMFGPLSLVFSNISVVIGGLVFGSSQSGKNKKILFAFLPSIIIMLTQSSKGLLFLSLFLFLGGILVSRVYFNKLSTFNFKIIIKVIGAAVSLIILIGLSFISRGLQNIEDQGLLLTKLRGLFASYFFTHIYGFSEWFTAYTGGSTSINYDTSNYYMGFYTLTSFFKMLGAEKVTSPGVYDEFFVYKDLLESNIYTIFRGLIMDFGMPGSLVFMLVMGFLVHFVYYLFLRQSRPVLTVLLVIFMLGFFYMTFIISMLTWVIIPFTFLICYLILKFNNYDFVVKRTV